MPGMADRKSTRLNSSHMSISYAVFCLKKKKHHQQSEREDKDQLTQRALRTLTILLAVFEGLDCLSFWIVKSEDSLAFFFFFNDTATTEIYTLSLHDALPI